MAVAVFSCALLGCAVGGGKAPEGQGAERGAEPAQVRTGPYLGEPLPGPDPVPSAPGIVSTGYGERDLTMTPDGRILFFMTGRTDWTLLAPHGEFDARALHAMMGQPNNGNWDIYWMDAAFLEELRPVGF